MAPATTVPIDSVRAALIEEWGRLRTLASRLDDAAWVRPSILPGWSTGDVIAHIIGTESILDSRAVPDVDISDAGHVRNAIGELNERWLTHFRESTRAQVLDAYDEIIAVRTTALNAMSQNDFDAQTLTPAGPDTYGRFMRIRTFDCWVHDIDLCDSMQLPAPTQAEPARWGIVEIFASLPYVVGKRVGAGTGTRVQFDVTGATSSTACVEVRERATLVDDFGSATPDVTLSLDAVDLARLAGGRSSADSSSVTITGDDEFGRRIVEKLNYVV